MNSALGIVAVLLILVAVVAYEIKRAINQRCYWERFERDWTDK